MAKAHGSAHRGDDKWWDESWNLVTGCSPISEGCKNCYARRMAETRLRGRHGYDPCDPFQVSFHEDKHSQPLHWRKPRRIFVCSMGDLFHENVPQDWIDNVFGVILACQVFENYHHTFMVLTKRPRRMVEYFADETLVIRWARAASCVAVCDDPDVTIYDAFVGSDTTWPLENLWLGVTAEDESRARERIPTLLAIPASKHFVSFEPLLDWGLPQFKEFGLPWIGDGLDWVIVGGETGPGARPMDLDWARDIRDQCRAEGVPFWFKKAGVGRETPEDLNIREFPRD